MIRVFSLRAYYMRMHTSTPVSTICDPGQMIGARSPPIRLSTAFYCSPLSQETHHIRTPPPWGADMVGSGTRQAPPITFSFPAAADHIRQRMPDIVWNACTLPLLCTRKNDIDLYITALSLCGRIYHYISAPTVHGRTCLLHVR